MGRCRVRVPALPSKPIGRLISPSHTRSYPLVAKRGRGVRVEDADGNEFLDFAAGIAVMSTGHCHPEVVDAVRRQAGELMHISGTDFYNEALTDLAERLSAVAPMPGPHRFFYGNSGAEAIECAFKLSRYHTGRQHMIAFFGAFHGRTMGALSLTGSKPQQKRRFAPLVPGVTHVRYPYAYRGPPAARRSRKLLPSTARATSKTCSSRPRCPPEEVAAIFVEPIQGEGGYVVAPDNFMRELRAICDRHRILLVVDEVQSGRTHRQVVGSRALRRRARHRLHRQGYRQRHASGRCMSRAEIMDWAPGSHASTSAATRSPSPPRLQPSIFSQREAIGNAARVGEFMLDRLRGWMQTHPLVGDVRGRGLMIGIELVKDKATASPRRPPRSSRDARFRARPHGSWLRPRPHSAFARRSSSARRKPPSLSTSSKMHSPRSKRNLPRPRHRQPRAPEAAK